MKFGFIFVILTILISINSYVILRGWQALPPASVYRPVFLITAIVLFLAMFVGMIFGNSMPQSLAKGISFAGFSYMVVFVYLFLSFLVVDVVRISNYFIHFAPAGMHAFRLWALIVTLVVTGIAMIYGNYKFNHPSVVTLNINSEKPLYHKHLKIVAVSDIHLGINIDKKRLQSYVKMINDQQPDLVLMAGDVSDRSMIPVILQNMAEEIRSIKAPLGVYAINGNHEHFAETPNATADYLEDAGVVDLRDQSFMVDSTLCIVGRDDRTNPNRKSLRTLMEGIDKKKFIILMDHQPFHLEEAEENGVDLQISGHTHNGQFFPGNLFVKNIYELGYGYMKKGETQYYVSSGLGLWGPQYRIGTQSELVVINLNY